MLTKYDLFIALLYVVGKTLILYSKQEQSFGNLTNNTDLCEDDLLEEVVSL
jgi:hypothetical protein